ncbi:hypothetical protein N7524_002540 [Penicillium chrysogenum]|nr:hypothetical protein N7524_002540 [Penicillium chrysogenum]
MQSIARDAIGTIVSVSADSNGSEKDLSFLILGYDMIVKLFGQEYLRVFFYILNFELEVRVMSVSI